MTEIRPAHSYTDLYTIPVVRNSEKINEMRNAVLAAADEFGFEVTQFRLRGEMGRIPTLFLTLERFDGVEFALQIEMPDGIRFLGLYVVGGHLRYVAELPAEMVEMLHEVPTLQAKESPKKPALLVQDRPRLVVPGRS